jgi:hypothetical protein
VKVSKFKVQGSRFRVQGSGFKVQGSRFRVQGSRFKVGGLVRSPASVIPANAGIQTGQWMPDQVRHDAFEYLIAGLINGLLVKTNHERIQTSKK